MTRAPASHSINEWLHVGTAELTEAAVESPHLDARLLIAAATDRDASKILMDRDSTLNSDQAKKFQDYIKRRTAGEPVSRILGQREFWSLPFKLSSDTLDPRPDSETVTEVALSLKNVNGVSGLSVLDIGVGSGCLLLSLLYEWPLATGVGLDISVGALETACANAQSLGMKNRTEFIASDWLEAISGPFDIIVSNPPYIRSNQISDLQTEVRKYDPLRALDGGADGLSAYRRIARDLGRVLAPNGIVVVEIGYDQEKAVRSIFQAAKLARIESHSDLGGHVRCISAALE